MISTYCCTRWTQGRLFVHSTSADDIWLYRNMVLDRFLCCSCSKAITKFVGFAMPNEKLSHRHIKYQWITKVSNSKHWLPVANILTLVPKYRSWFRSCQRRHWQTLVPLVTNYPMVTIGYQWDQSHPMAKSIFSPSAVLWTHPLYFWYTVCFIQYYYQSYGCNGRWTTQSTNNLAKIM